MLPAALACAVVALPAAARAEAVPGDGALSPTLVQLARPAVRQLSHAAQANLLDVAPSGAGSLLREAGRVLVDVRFEAGALARREALERAGADVIAASARYQTVTAAVAPADLREVAAVPGVGSVTPVPAPALHAAGGCEGGSVISEGVGQLGVQAAREEFALRGAGVTVGVLSDSYDMATTEAFSSGPIATHAADDVKSNDLPGPAATCSDQQLAVDVLEDWSPAMIGPVHDEGRAMLQIVHDVAPHAKLAFATAFGSELSFAENIERLARPVSAGGAGAEVIVDDVSYLEEPFFQDGPVANAIAKVSSEGVTYLTAAGNENVFDSLGREIASWEAPEFRDAGTCPAAVQSYLTAKGYAPHCMDFDPGVGEDSGFGLTVKREGEVKFDLQWAQPWNGVSTDLDAFLVAGGEVVAKKEENNVGTTKRPVEWFGWRNSKTTSQEVQLVINRCTATCNPLADPLAKPRLKLIVSGGVTKTEYPSSSGGDVVGPTVYGHAASSSAITLGAVRYNNGAEPEEFSSRGPAKHFFAPVAGKTAAEPIGEEVIDKPDVVATDCGATTFFAQFQLGVWRFCGTSAAAPHAAGIAALMVQGAPATPTPAEIGEKLAESAQPLAGFGPEAVGAGLVEAKGALQAIGAAPGGSDGPSVTVPPVVEYETEVEPEDKGPEVTVTPSDPIVPQAQLPEAKPEAKLAPSTSIRAHPRKLIRTRRALARAVFRFASGTAGATFRCQFDGSPWRGCTSPLTRWFGLGQHVVRVQARHDGVLDPTPAVFRFRVARSLRAARG